MRNHGRADKRIFRPHVVSVCKLMILEPPIIWHCVLMKSREREKCCVTFCLYYWWPGAESNHRHADFQSVAAGSWGLILHRLQRLPSPTPASPRHNPGTPKLSSSHPWHTGAYGFIATTLL